jgi:UPF0716 protein FxsA
MALPLVLAFLLVPLAEIYVIIQVGHAIGAWQTLVLLIVWSAIGAWIVKHEGRRAWRSFRAAAESGRLPGREAADGALVLVGGTLLLTPGFITDVVGLFLVLPFTRPLARRLAIRLAARRATRRLRGRGSGRWDGRADGGVIDGEVLRRPDERER